MKRKYGFLAGLDFATMPTEHVVAPLAETGYQAVSWPLERFNPKTTTAQERYQVVSATHESGLSVSEWVLQQDYVHPDSGVRRERIQLSADALRAIAALDMSVQAKPAPVNLFTGPAPWDSSAPRLGKDVSEGAAWGMVYEAFDTLVPLAEELDVDLAVEGVFGHLVHDYYTARELVRHYDSPRLGVNFDPSHGILYGNDTAWATRQWGQHIKHVHLKDAVGCPGMPGETFIFPLLGEGRVPWQSFYAALDEIGYDGFLTVEFESFDYYRQVLDNDPAAAARLSMQQLRRLEDMGE